MRSQSPTKPGPKPIDLSILASSQTRWLSLLELLEYGSEKQRELRTEWEPPEQPKLYPDGDERNAKLLERYEELLRGSKQWRLKIREVETEAIAPERKTIDAIFAAETSQQMRYALKSSPLLMKHLRYGSPLRQLLKDATPLFLRAVREAKRYRFPASDRNTSESKKLVHLSSALAGIECGLSAASAIDRLRKLKHGKKCPCAPCSLNRDCSLNKIVRPIMKAYQEKIETNPPLGVFYLTLPPRETQRRSKRPTPTMTRTGKFQMTGQKEKQ